MLVLTRKQQEKIQIGDDIVITVLKTKGKTVRIGIEAPSTTPVLRGELAVRIQDEEASKATASADEPKPRAITQSTDTPPTRSDEPSSDNGDAPRVSLDRVPRSRVSTVLSEKLGAPVAAGHGPLRAMLDRRVGAAL